MGASKLPILTEKNLTFKYELTSLAYTPVQLIKTTFKVYKLNFEREFVERFSRFSDAKITAYLKLIYVNLGEAKNKLCYQRET